MRDAQALRILNWVQGDNTPVHSQSGYGIRDPQTKELIASSFSYSAFRSLQDHVPQFSDLVGFEDDDFAVTANGTSEVAVGQSVSGNYFTGLGAGSITGRVLTSDDDAPGSAPVVVLTYRYWEKRFGLDPRVIGREIIINRTSATVIGVTPPAFQGLYPGAPSTCLCPCP